MITTNSSLITPRLTMFLVVLATVSCDTLSEDQISLDKQLTFGQTHFYVVHGSSLFIDVNSFIDESFVDATLVISTPPSKGVLSRVDDVLLRYEPDEDFEGTDEVVLSVRIDGENRHTETINITIVSEVEELPCGLYAIGDNVEIVAGISVVIPVLKNDGVCGAGSSAPEVSVYSLPTHGEASVADNVITYTPGSTFGGNDEFIYKLSASPGDSISYAAVKITSDWAIESFEVPEKLSEMSFPDPMTGFIAGIKMYKTTNGGKSWTQLTLPTDGDINHLQFLNKDLGYATYNSCEVRDSESNCVKWNGGLLKTSDGGESWDLVNLNVHTASVFFTSATTGYVSGIPHNSIPQPTVYKTEDGGEHWEEVFSTTKETGVEIEFATSNIGYLVGPTSIYITKDAGQSWQESTPGGVYSLFGALAVTKDFAFSGDIGDVETSTIERSTHGGNWQPVMIFPYNIWELGFSASGNLGIAAGMSKNVSMSDPTTWEITIKRTVDQGETWIMETGEKPMGFPWDISVPSDQVAYILCDRKLIRYSIAY